MKEELLLGENKDRLLYTAIFWRRTKVLLMQRSHSVHYNEFKKLKKYELAINNLKSVITELWSALCNLSHLFCKRFWKSLFDARDPSLHAFGPPRFTPSCRKTFQILHPAAHSCVKVERGPPGAHGSFVIPEWRSLIMFPVGHSYLEEGKGAFSWWRRTRVFLKAAAAAVALPLRSASLRATALSRDRAPQKSSGIPSLQYWAADHSCGCSWPDLL